MRYGQVLNEIKNTIWILLMIYPPQRKKTFLKKIIFYYVIRIITFAVDNIGLSFHEQTNSAEQSPQQFFKQPVQSEPSFPKMQSYKKLN